MAGRMEERVEPTGEAAVHHHPSMHARAWNAPKAGMRIAKASVRPAGASPDFRAFYVFRDPARQMPTVRRGSSASTANAAQDRRPRLPSRSARMTPNASRVCASTDNASNARTTCSVRPDYA